MGVSSWVFVRTFWLYTHTHIHNTPARTHARTHAHTHTHTYTQVLSQELQLYYENITSAVLQVIPPPARACTLFFTHSGSLWRFLYRALALTLLLSRER
jgi:hypothetical protein